VSGPLRVLVTGGASGLGAALAQRYAARGDRVLSADLSHPPAELSERQSAMAQRRCDKSVVRRRLDVTSEDDWVAARDWVDSEWGGLDLLVNNAGVAGGGRVELTSIEDWQWILDVNLLGVVRGVRAFTPMLKAQGSGWIVNTASLAGLVHPPGMGSYNAVKAAVVAFSETVGHELAPYGVGCSAVCPSYFRTNLMDSMRGQDADLAAHVAQLVDRSPITADDIAAVVVDAVDRREELIVPDEPARVAWTLKREDRGAYDATMRGTAARMKERTS
jgi:NAD(P)-dependent dehydrogenase (short-subunit alcohol dehydrogenase family)